MREKISGLLSAVAAFVGFIVTLIDALLLGAGVREAWNVRFRVNEYPETDGLGWPLAAFSLVSGIAFAVWFFCALRGRISRRGIFQTLFFFSLLQFVVAAGNVWLVWHSDPTWLMDQNGFLGWLPPTVFPACTAIGITPLVTLLMSAATVCDQLDARERHRAALTQRYRHSSPR